MELNEIQTVKIQGEGYLVNGSMSVPKADGNRHYEAIKLWLAEGNTPEPEFTDAELAQQELDATIQEYKEYLDKTDYKMLPNYVAKPDEDLDAIIITRNEYREFIRTNQ